MHTLGDDRRRSATSTWTRPRAVAGSRAAMHLSMIILPGPLDVRPGLDDASRTSRAWPCRVTSPQVGFRNDGFTPPPDQPYLGYGFATFVDGGPVGSGQDLVAANFGTHPDRPVGLHHPHRPQQPAAARDRRHHSPAPPDAADRSVELALQDLPAARARQRVDEHDLARDLEARQPRADVVAQLLGRDRARRSAGTTNARRRWPNSSSGTPTTAASATAGWRTAGPPRPPAGRRSRRRRRSCRRRGRRRRGARRRRSGRRRRWPCRPSRRSLLAAARVALEEQRVADEDAARSRPAGPGARLVVEAHDAPRAPGGRRSRARGAGPRASRSWRRRPRSSRRRCRGGRRRRPSSGSTGRRARADPLALTARSDEVS